MKKHILIKNKEEIFERNQHIQIEFKLKGEHNSFFSFKLSSLAWKWLDVFQACEYDKQTNILGVNYVAYGIAKTRQSLNSPAVPYIEAFADKENLEMQQELQKRLCVSEMKRLIKANQEIRFHNTEYGIEGAGKSLAEAIETFIDNAVKSFVKNDIDPRGDKEEYGEIYFYNMENCEVYLPKKYVNKIWDKKDDEYSVINFFYDETTKAEKLREMNEGR